MREAWSWDAEKPLWFRQADTIFNKGTVADWVAQLADNRRWLIGVFSPGLEAVVVVERHGNGQFEGHLTARRHADVQMITTTITYLLHDLLDMGMIEAFCWIAEKNRSVRNLCSTIGFRPDGIVMYRGAYRGRVIKWIRYSVQVEEIPAQNAA